MTLDEEISLAVGRLGMSLSTYLQLTPMQFRQVYENYQEQERAEFEAADLSRWRVARWQAWRALCPPEKKSISQFDLIELPGDKEIKKQIRKAKAEAKKRPRKINPRNEQRFRYFAEKWTKKE